MSLLGKLLLVLSLLAAAGAVYLGAQDWKGRQTIAAGGLRHVLLLTGLPLGDKADDPSDMSTDPEAEVPFRVETAGGVPTESVSPDLLKAYFAPSGEPPVPNQLAEVKRVYARLKGEIQKLDGSAQRAPVAAAALLLQAETYEERVEILTLQQALNGDELAHLLDLKFHRVIPKVVEGGPIAPDKWQAAPERVKQLEAAKQAADEAAAKAEGAGNTAEAQKKRAEAGALVGELERRTPRPAKDDAERRARLAHLLVHLDPSAAWQKRTAMVVGLQRYVRAVAEQAVRFADMASRVERATIDDQGRFVEAIADLRRVAIDRTHQAREKAEIRARLQDEKDKDTEFVAQRQTQLADLTAQLTQVKAAVDRLLAQQTQVEQQLFEVQRQVGQTLEAIYQLEAELAKRERERYSGAGR